MEDKLVEEYKAGMKGRIKEKSDRIRSEIGSLIKKQVDGGKRPPKLSVIMVGDNPASEIYVRNKVKACEKAGIIDDTVRFPSGAEEDEVITKIQELNQDNTVDGIMVQLPLPGHMDTDRVIRAISPRKDVDGFTPYNLGLLYSGSGPICLPCTPFGILSIIDLFDQDLEGKNAVVIGRSREVGLPIAKLLLDENMSVAVCHSKTRNLKDIARRADVLVCAVGKPKFISKDMVKDGAVVIDVGINRVDGKVCGDVDYGSVLEVTKNVTPVPGGCGIMTVTALIENTFALYSGNIL